MNHRRWWEPVSSSTPARDGHKRGRATASARGRRLLIALAAVMLLSTVIYSYTTTMLKPSSLPLGVRTVEWIRAHHGNWFADEAEHFWYSWHAPKRGGPQLESLPRLGLAPAMTPSLKAGRTAMARPPAIKPVFPRPLPGEGIWKRAGPLVDGASPVLITTFRTELDYPEVVAYVAWFDHTRTALAWYPGRYEPPNAPVRGPMMVPQDQRWRLLATFNGAFTYAAGLNGSSVNGRTNEPLRDGLATLIGYRDGRVNVTTWTGGRNAGPQIAFARQSLRLIIDRGRLNPALDTSDKWGYTLGGKVRVWRTGVGIDRRGNLIYAAANYQTVITLAQILQRVGAVRAMQFDINPEWPTLITYSHRGGLGLVKVLPNYQQPAARYLVPDDRDFFAVYKRLVGPVTVPFN